MSEHAGFCVALVAARLALSPSPSSASPAEDVATGIELYWSGQYRETVAFLSPLCGVENRNDVSVECYKYLAFSHVALGDAEMAQGAFSQLLARDAEYQLDESLVSPKILEQFRASRRRLSDELFAKGKIAYIDEDYAAAKDLFARVLQIDPEQVLAREYSQLATEQLSLLEKRASLAAVEVPDPPPPAPVEEEPEDRVYHLTSRISPPVLVSSVRPAYPLPERRARREGMVIVAAVVGQDGAVRDPKVIRSASPGFAAAAIDAVLQWRYRPAQLDGRDVAVYTVVRLDFDLDP